jgi:DNA-binding response OmpR family regulator
VEDDKGINELIKRTLHMTGHHGFSAYSGREAVSIVKKAAIDLVLLDISLPDCNGFMLMRQLGKDMPVIFVTARSEVVDRVKGLNCGAEDYIVKPFAMDELIARVQVVLRRQNKQQSVYCIGEVKVDLERHLVFRKGESLDITNREFELLKILIINRNIALSRSRLLDLAWGDDYDGEERTVDVHIQRLRKKLNLESQIKTIFKLGYRMEF